MEANNMAAMREALEMMSALFAKGVICTSYANTPEEMEQIEELYQKAKAALAAPPRNCDVGTAEEKQDRFREFCRHYESEGECGIGRSEAACPAFQGGRNPDCSLWWAQMPYQEGGAR